MYFKLSERNGRVLNQCLLIILYSFCWSGWSSNNQALTFQKKKQENIIVLTTTKYQGMLNITYILSEKSRAGGG